MQERYGTDRLALPRMVALGASAGGIEALMQIVHGLPSDLPASVCVVLHVSPTGTSRLPEILSNAGKLPATHAGHGDRIEPGRIYIAPPDRHLTIVGPCLELVEGPSENNFRPAIDPLFRSAAAQYGPRLIAGVLSGMMDDGTAGLAVAKAAGAITIAQDPDDAQYAPMPASVIEHVGVDHVLPASEIAGLLVRLLATKASVLPTKPMILKRSTPTDQVCPDCGGVLRQLDESGVLRFRCRVGHAYSSESLLGAQDKSLEGALWAAIRALEESSSLSGRLARGARGRGAVASADRYERRQRDSGARADIVRSAILALSGLEDTPPAADVRDSYDSATEAAAS